MGPIGVFVFAASFAVLHALDQENVFTHFSSGAPSQKLSTKQCFCGSKSCRKFLPSVAC